MEYFEKKITYLRGLCDGSDFPAESKEGKIFHGILDVLDDMAFMLETFMDDEDLVMEDEDLDETDEPIFFYSFNCPSCGQELDVDEQTMEMQTEIPCPGCGMTRAWLSLLRGDFAGAFRAHPLFWTLPFLVLLFLFAGRMSKKAVLILAVLAGVLFGGVYIARMVLYFPHQEPMTINHAAPLIRILEALHILA